MVNPNVVASSETNSSETSNTTSHTVNVSNGGADGDTIFVLFSCDGNPTITWPSPWSSNILFNDAHSGGQPSLSMAWKKKSGSETTIAITTGAAEQSTHLSFTVENAADPATTPPTAATTVEDNSTTPDPPNHSGTSGDNLAIAVANIDRRNLGASPYPANMDDFQYSSTNGSTGNAKCATAAEAFTGTDFNPDNFSFGATADRNLANTIIVFEAVTGATERTGSDGLFVDTFDRRLRDTRRLSDLLLGDVTRSERESVRAALDALLLGDDAQSIKIAVRFAADNLLLDDVLRRALEGVRDDTLLFDVVSRRQREMRLLDSLLLGVTASAQAGAFVTARDGLLFDDQRLSVLDKTIAEQLLLSDALYRAIEKRLRDALLLGDDATASYIPGFLGVSRSVTDGLFFVDQTLKTTDLTQADSLLLSDQRFSQLLRRLLDSLLLGDSATASRGRIEARTVVDALLMFDQLRQGHNVILFDRLLLDETTRRLRELLIRENVLLGDSVTRSVIEAIIGKVFPLGIRINAEDNLLGVTARTADLLGISTSVVGISASI